MLSGDSKRIIKSSEIQKGDILYKVCMGEIYEVVITSSGECVDILGRQSKKWDYTIISDVGRGLKTQLFERDFGVGVSGTTCNALFKEKSDAIAYTNLYNYNLAVEQHQKLCDELFREMHGLYSIYSRPPMRGKGVIISEDQI
ncbi:MAG: hypothetical protein R3230_01150 [Nitrosopumilaceae archaeon]|nr:hypothetical protein [Nitrosopumilaceae archaeon]